MKITATYEYDIGTHFITAIEYGDISGLDDNDIERFNAFMNDISPSSNSHMTCEYPDLDNETSFDRCDITGLRSDTTRLLVHYMR